MRKLLSILASVSLTASVATTTVSCTSNKMNLEVARQANDINNLKIGVAQAAKSLVLNHENDLSIDYTMDNFFSPSVIEDNFSGFNKNDFQGVSRTRFTAMFKKYFNSKNPIKKDSLNSSLEIKDGRKPQSGGSILTSLAGFSGLIKTITSGNFLELIIGMADSSGLVEEMLDPLLGKTVAGLLDEQTLNALGQAFDLSCYNGMAYQDVLQNGMNSLSNGLVRLSNNPNNLTYAKIGVPSDKNNDNLASENLQKTLPKIKSILANLDIVENLQAVGDILHFAIITLTYLNQFDKFRSFTPSDSEHLFVSGEKNITTLNKIRDQNFNVTDSEPDIKKLVASLKFYLSVDEKDVEGRNFQRLISILFESKSIMKPLAGPSFSVGGINWLFKPIVGIIAEMNDMNNFTAGIFEGILGIFANNLANQDSLKVLIKYLKGPVVWRFLPEEMKEMVKMIENSEEYYNNPYKAFYSGSGLGPIINMMSSTSSNDSLNIKSFLGSVSPTIDAMADKLNVDRYENVNSSSTIKIQELGKFFTAVGEKEEWTDSSGKKKTTTVLEHALTDSKNMFENLGYDKKTKSFVSNKPLSILKNFLSQSADGLSDIDDILSMVGEKKHIENQAFNEEVNKLTSQTSDWEIIDFNEDYIFEDIINHLAIELSHNFDEVKNTYTITAQRNKNGYFTISSFEIKK
ncbi:MOLPALP family lipoprotein [Spiroplasma endosymbiont of Panorpa germanica]|uniref:MOLPALP family lipoprotein n=1 Tax=Spiroplasma endosymbiont of Panorpa germanica TaxID=3066314 RepID=UPI0030CCB9B5